MKAIGIDIGTTSICLVGYDGERGEIIEKQSTGNAFIPGSFQQDARRIVAVVEELLESIIAKMGEVDAIGVSGQMHGILYVDKHGDAVSPYYTWKTEFGDKAFRSKTYAQYLSQNLENIVYTGYGSVTHFYLHQTGGIPEKAVFLANIGDYLVMRLCQKNIPVMSSSVADSMGAFNMEKMEFDMVRLKAAGVPVEYYPTVGADIAVAGTYKGIPVTTAMGDNQASFYGAVGEAEDKISINVGTGSQVSLFAPQKERLEKGEVRPFTRNGYLYVQTSVNGGKVYEKLADFFREVVYAFSGKDVDVYKRMAELGEGCRETDLQVTPSLYGARSEQSEAGKLAELKEHNFHPEDLIRAYVRGMAEELYRLYLAFPEVLRHGRNEIIASGNGVRKNTMLKQEIENVFGLPVRFCEVEEEAAAGAAMMALERGRGIECTGF